MEYLYTNNLQEAKDYPTKVVDLGGRTRTYGYDPEGNLTTTTDLAGNVYGFEYGTNGVSSITSPMGSQINYEYDSNGNVTKMSYSSPVARRLSLRSSLLASSASAASAATTPPPAKTYTYDSNERLATITNASGSQIANTYDTNGNISLQTVTDEYGNVSTIATVYGANDEVSSLTNNTGTTSYQYDANGYVSQITAANGSIISYVRDGEGQIIEQTERANAVATGLTTKYSYDLFGKLLTVTDSRNRTTTMTYDLVNRLETKTLPNGVKTTYGYDALDLITSLVYTKADGTVLASQTYTRNPGGEPNRILREDGSYTLYDYDPANRLSKEVSYNPTGVAVRSIEYSYDLDGKRTRKVNNLGTEDYTYNPQGQLATAGTNLYTYDVDGRLSQIDKGTQTVDLTHDTFDRLTQVTNNGTTTNYLYDANGNRIREISGSNTKNYLVAPNLENGLESTDLVTDGSGNVVSDYVYGGSEIIARLDASGNPIYYLTDDLGSVIGLVDAAGNIQSRIIYDGFGEVVSGDDGSSQGGDFRFQGQWLEGESGLYYMRARDYDPNTGLFLSRDAVDVQDQDVEAFNPYQFAYGNPLVFSDPTGMFSILELNAALDTQNALEALKTYSAQQAKQYLQQKLGEALGNAFTNVVKRILPLGDLDFGQLPKRFQSGTGFENFLKGQICGIFNAVGGPFSDRLWIEPTVTGNGKPTYPGINCQGVFSRKTPVLGTGSHPDFIFKNGSPVNYRIRDPQSFLIGDIKITYNKALREITGLGLGKNGRDRSPSNQWLAISKYAGQYEATRMALYITFSRTSKSYPLSASDEIALTVRASANAIRAGVLLIIARLSD